MKILAFDSAAKSCSAAILENSYVLGYARLDVGLTHSASLLPLIDQLLSSCGMSPADMDLFAATRGPGSFTGLRIGLATLKGLCWGLDRPCAGVSTLEAIAAAHAAFSCENRDVLALLDARNDRFYAAAFRVSCGVATRETPDDVLTSGELLLSRNASLAIGDGARLFCDRAIEQGRPDFDSPHVQTPAAIGAAFIAAALREQDYQRPEDVAASYVPSRT